ncbi:MAG: TIM barrel protein [Halioglobus sp.]|nr:TIM barrel protein [Halioglobus sp.]
MSDARLISLAAGVVQEFPAEDAVRAAAPAGFNAAGIWCDTQTWNAATTRRVEEALAETGICPLDLEVVWLKPGEAPTAHDQMIDIGLELGVRNILCVSSEPEMTRTKKRFEHICRRAESGNTRIVLEFLAITEIRSLQQALEVVQDVAHPAGGILVDSLHLHRTGGSADDLGDIDPRLMPYIQLCDASAVLGDSSPEGLIEDALYLRQLPGEGDLALHDILDKLDPQLPLSLEIRSRELMQRSVGDPNARARIVFLAMQHFLRSSIA